MTGANKFACAAIGVCAASWIALGVAITQWWLNATDDDWSEFVNIMAADDDDQ